MGQQTRQWDETLQDYSTLKDESLIRLIAEGDEAALEALFDRHVRLLFSISVHLVGNQLAAEEIALDVFVRVWENAESYQPERAKVTTWLTTITRYRAIDYLRRQGRRPESDSVSWDVLPVKPLPPQNSPEQLAGNALRRERIRGALRQIPDEQRRVLLLAYFGGLTQQEIADRLDLPLGTVKTRIRLGLQKLRFLLRGEESPGQQR
ncbi:MAG: sigma-70 family RNA polymerase sigma factor [Candidatus Promineifilaceae bacterium]|nr:sigma-70 family RNA polymerase sigma factor [Candidatus Promineifilaceae bacterium]